MAMKSDSGSDLNAEINVTPMIDVMLVLLVIFIIAAPMMSTGVDLDLPDTRAQAIDNPEDTIRLTVKPDGTLEFRGKPVLWRSLGQTIAGDADVQVDKSLMIEADQNLPYGVVVTAMAIVKDHGVDNVKLLTDPTQDLGAEELDARTGQ